MGMKGAAGEAYIVLTIFLLMSGGSKEFTKVLHFFHIQILSATYSISIYLLSPPSGG